MTKKHLLPAEIRLSKYLAASLGVAFTGALTQSAVAQATWVGDTSSDYNDAANWSSDPAAPSGNLTLNGAGIAPVIGATPTWTTVDIFVGSGTTGSLSQNAGTLSTGLNNWIFIGQNASGNGTYNISGSGSLSAGKLNVGAWGSSGAVGNMTVNTSGTADFYNTSNRNTAIGSASILVGENGSTGTLNLQNGTVTSAGSSVFGQGGSSVGNLNMSGGSLATTGLTAFGRGGGSGSLSISNGTLSSTGEFQFGAGAGAVGNATQSGGTVSSGSWFVVGREGTATYDLSNGTVNAATGAGAATIGSFGTANGALNVSGGAFNSTFGGGSGGSSILVGEGGAGALTVSGSGLVNAGVFNVRLADNGTAVGTVNLNGGTIQAGGVTRGTGTTATFNFNGGTLQATQDNATFMSGLDVADIQAGGAFIDSNGHAITIGQALTGVGDFTKLGMGSLTLTGANLWGANTSIMDGLLSINGTYLSNSSMVSIASTATFNLATGGDDVIGSLFYDGVDQGSGTFGAIGSGAQHEVSWITGDGTLTVVPEPGTYALAIAGLLGLVAAGRRRRKA